MFFGAELMGRNEKRERGRSVAEAGASWPTELQVVVVVKGEGRGTPVR